METEPTSKLSHAATAAFADYLQRESLGEAIPPTDFVSQAAPEIRAELTRLLQDLALLRKKKQTLNPTTEAGSHIGPYRLLKQLGTGGAGVVWRALDTRLQREVALKVLHSHLTLSSKQVERFKVEASTNAGIRHPGIIQVYDVGYAQGTHYIAQELVAHGRTLADFISERSQLMLAPSLDREAVSLFAEVARSVGAAHEAGIVHRDLKPANILLTPEKHIRITDFGLARLAGTTTLTNTSARSGTPFYLSPEQAEGNRKVDARSDVFSLGITLYELLTLQRPFGGDTPEEVALSILRADPIPPRKLRPGIPKELSWIVCKALERDPAKRYENADKLGQDLERWLTGREIEARAMLPHERLAKYSQRNPGKAIGSVVGGIALVAISSLLFANRGLHLEVERDNVQLHKALKAAREAASYMAAENVEERDSLPPSFLINLVGTARESLPNDSEAFAQQLAMAGTLYNELGFTLEAVELLEEATRLLAANRPPGNKQLFELRLQLLDALVMRFELEDALELGEQLLNEIDAAAGPRNIVRVAQVQSRLLRALRWTSGLSIAQQMEARFGAVTDNLETAILTLSEGDTLLKASLQIQLALSLNKAAGVDRSIALTEDAYASFSSHLGAGSLQTLEASYWLNSLRYKAGDHNLAHDGAVLLVRQAATSLGPKHPLSLHAKWFLAQADMKLNKMERAYNGYTEAVHDLAEWLPWESPRMLAIRTAWAMSANYTGRFEIAEQQLLELIETKNRVLGEGSISTLITRRAYGEVLLKTYQFQAAEFEFREQIRLHELYRDSKTHLETLESYRYLAISLYLQDDWEGLADLDEVLIHRIASTEEQASVDALNKTRAAVLTYQSEGPAFIDEALELAHGYLRGLPDLSNPANDLSKLHAKLWIARLMGLASRYQEQLRVLDNCEQIAEKLSSIEPMTRLELLQLRAEAQAGLGQEVAAKSTLANFDWMYFEKHAWPEQKRRLARIVRMASVEIPEWLKED